MRRRTPLTLALLFAGLAGALPVRAQQPVVYRLAVSGVVENGLAPYIARGLNEAASAGAPLPELASVPGPRVHTPWALDPAERDRLEY